MTMNYKLSLDLSSTASENFYFWKENIYQLVNYHYAPKPPYKLVQVFHNNQLLWEADGGSFCTKVIVCHSDGQPLLLHISFVSDGLKEVSYFVNRKATERDTTSDTESVNIPKPEATNIDLAGKCTDNTNPNVPENNEYLSKEILKSNLASNHCQVCPDQHQFDAECTLDQTVGFKLKSNTDATIDNEGESVYEYVKEKVPLEWVRINSHDFYLRFHRLVESKQVLQEFDLVLTKPDEKKVFVNKSPKILVDVYVPGVGYKMNAVKDGRRDVWRSTSPNFRCSTVFAHPKANYSYLHLVIEGYLDPGMDLESVVAQVKGPSEGSETGAGFGSRYARYFGVSGGLFGRSNRSAAEFGANKLANNEHTTSLSSEGLNLTVGTHRGSESLNGPTYFKTDVFYKKAFMRWNRISRSDYFGYFELDFGRTGLNNEVCNLDKDLYCYYYKKIHLSLDELNEAFRDDTEHFEVPDSDQKARDCYSQSVEVEDLGYLNESFYIVKNHFCNITNVCVTPKPGFVLKEVHLEKLRLTSGYSEYILYANLHYYMGNLASFYLILSMSSGENALYFLKKDGMWVSVSFTQYMRSFSNYTYFTAAERGLNTQDLGALGAVNVAGQQPNAAGNIVRLTSPYFINAYNMTKLSSAENKNAELNGVTLNRSLSMFSTVPDSTRTTGKLARTHSMLSTNSTSRSSSFSLSKRGVVLSSSHFARLRNNFKTLRANLSIIRLKMANLPGVRGIAGLTWGGKLKFTKRRGIRNSGRLSARLSARASGRVTNPSQLKNIKLSDLLRKRPRDEPFMGKIFTSSFRNKNNLLIKTYFSPAENYSNPRRVFRHRLYPGPPNGWSGDVLGNGSKEFLGIGLNSPSASLEALSSSSSLSPVNALSQATMNIPERTLGIPLSPVSSFRAAWSNRTMRWAEGRVTRRTRLRDRLWKLQRGLVNPFVVNGLAGRLPSSRRLGSARGFHSGRLFSARTIGNSEKNVILVGGLASTFLESFMSVNVHKFLQKNNYLNLNPYLSHVPKYNVLAVTTKEVNSTEGSGLTLSDSTTDSTPNANNTRVTSSRNTQYLLSKRYYRKYGELFNSSSYYGDDLLDVFRSFSYTGSFVELMNRMGYNVYAMDIQSHGLSEGARELKCFAEKFDDYVDDLLQYVGIVKSGRFFEHGQTSSDIVTPAMVPRGGQYVLVGFSMGANIAVQAIVSHMSSASKCSNCALTTAPNLVDTFLSLNGMYNVKELCGKVGRHLFPFLSGITSLFVPTKPSPGSLSREYATSFRVYKSFNDAYYYVFKHRHLKCLQIFKACDKVLEKFKRYPKDLKTFIIHSRDDNRCHISGANTFYDHINNGRNEYIQINSNFHSIVSYEFLGLMTDILSKILVQ
ncbi:hypothetical protein MACK_000029 [Theileria orientalis]|uniref:Serine aminopeptidase S33 domain-containing protein n=1 Tax=Theileria orientalis TaxID=68886 RepID=A0A976M959_THEOR|nr:hypothetical protein MACK_000029 [Theileria orientalis]